MIREKDVIEMRREFSERIKRLEDIVLEAGLCLDEHSKESVEQYKNSKLEEVDCNKVPINEIYSHEELKMLNAYAKEHRCEAIYDAFCIGFANGVKWERKI